MPRASPGRICRIGQTGKLAAKRRANRDGLDAHRYRHLKRSARKQWQAGKPAKGEHSNQQLWQHIDRLNDDAAHQVARSNLHALQDIT